MRYCHCVHIFDYRFNNKTFKQTKKNACFKCHLSIYICQHGVMTTIFVCSSIGYCYSLTDL